MKEEKQMNIDRKLLESLIKKCIECWGGMHSDEVAVTDEYLDSVDESIRHLPMSASIIMFVKRATAVLGYASNYRKEEIDQERIIKALEALGVEVVG